MPIGQNFTGGFRSGLAAAELQQRNKLQAEQQRQQNQIEIGKKVQADIAAIAKDYETRKKTLTDKMELPENQIPEIRAKYQRELEGLDQQISATKLHFEEYYNDLIYAGFPAQALPPRALYKSMGGPILSTNEQAQQEAQAAGMKEKAKAEATADIDVRTAGRKPFAEEVNKAAARPVEEVFQTAEGDSVILRKDGKAYYANTNKLVEPEKLKGLRKPGQPTGALSDVSPNLAKPTRNIMEKSLNEAYAFRQGLQEVEKTIEEVGTGVLTDWAKAAAWATRRA